MNLIELKKQLDDLGVNENSYSLGENFEDEQYCLEKTGEKWHYYYSERGEKTGERVFDCEDDACEFMHSILENDPTVRY